MVPCCFLLIFRACYQGRVDFMQVESMLWESCAQEIEGLRGKKTRK